MTAERPVVGVGGVLLRDGLVLLVRRGKPPLQGRWAIPGGTVERGETLEQALVREMEEETGLRIEPGEMLTVVDWIEREGDQVVSHFVIVDFLCRWLSGETKAGSDAAEAAWVRSQDLAAYELPRQTLEVLQDAFDRQRTGYSR